jgi:hypothetical protein
VNERSAAVTQRVRDALQASTPESIVKGVKDAVASELSSLSPDAKLTYTSYFNHSYMPDMVLDWTDGGRVKESRPIFLRNRLGFGGPAGDVRDLASRNPVILSLSPTPDNADRVGALRSQVSRASRTLVTEVASLAEVAADTSSPGGASPLMELVRNNLIRGGRGVLTSDDAERLVQSAQPEISSKDGLLSADFVGAFLEQAEAVFAPDAALRLQRSAELLRFGLTGVQGEGTQDGGRLSRVELRVLLPYLLSQEASRANAELWVRIGAMMTFEDLEDMWPSLPDLDVKPLVLPNLRTWTAKRSQFVLNSTFEAAALPATAVVNEDSYLHPQALAEDLGAESDPETLAPDALEMSSWTVRNKMLAIELGELRILLSSDSRRLRGRDLAGVYARWDDISGLLDGFELVAVDLRGASRRIYVSSEGSGNVKADVSRIRETIEDDFHVAEVAVLGPEDDPSAVMAVHFGSAIATASAGAPLLSLLQAAVLLLAYRMPIEVRARLAAAADESEG